MKITKSWINEFIDLSHISTNEICTTLNAIGLEVDNVLSINIPNDVVVGYVNECVKHPDADKLNICQVDLGSEIVQIVCGAKNVKKGQFVPVAIVGCNLGNDFLIKKATLRGVNSNGMICSSTEIGLAKMNDGILELDNSFGKLQLGKNLNEYSLLNDDIIEIELTANRGDCLCVKGIAQDLSAFYDIQLIKQDLTIKENKEAIGRVLNIINTSENDSNLLYKVANISVLTVPLLLKIRSVSVDIEKDTDIELLVAYATHATGVLLNIYCELADEKSDKIQLKIKKDDNGFAHIVAKETLSIVGV